VNIISGPVNNRVILFDILRIIAIFLVVFAHLCQFLGSPGWGGFFGIWNFFWVSSGGIGVTIFLIVSGGSLALNYPSFPTWNAVKRFYTGRLIRIYPAYWLATFFTILIYSAFIPGFPGILSLQTILLTLSGLYVFLDVWGGPVMSIGWFVGLILALYLLYPLLIQGFNKDQNGTLIFLLIISVTARIVCGYLLSEGIGHRLIDWVPFCRLFEFGLGIYIVRAGLGLDRVHVSEKIASVIIFASSLTYPVFLINSSFFQTRDLFKAFSMVFGLSLFQYCAVSIILTLLLALVILFLDQPVQKRLRQGSVRITGLL
jgi:peptidoglycan/LPS O-acetylase OafA/YrhL